MGIASPPFASHGAFICMHRTILACGQESGRGVWSIQPPLRTDVIVQVFRQDDKDFVQKLDDLRYACGLQEM